MEAILVSLYNRFT